MSGALEINNLVYNANIDLRIHGALVPVSQRIEDCSLLNAHAIYFIHTNTVRYQKRFVEDNISLIAPFNGT